MSSAKALADTALADLNIGERVKELRKTQGYSLNELAQMTGISEATLSRVENNQTLITAHNLYILSKVLGVDITAFFKEATTPIRTGIRSVCRKGDGVPIDTARYTANVLCADLANKKMHPSINTVSIRSMQEAGGFNRHEGEEFLFVLSGTLILQTEFYAPLELEAGDSVYFDSNMGHAYLAGGDEPVQILVLATTSQGSGHRMGAGL